MSASVTARGLRASALLFGCQAVIALSMPAAGLAFQAGQETRSGPQLIHDGKLEEALEVFRAGVEAFPKSVPANNGAGVVLDLLGRYAEAQKYFGQAIKAAATPLEKAQAQRAMAISFGFATDCKGVAKYDLSAYEYYLAAPDFYSAGEVADELGRLCLDAGDTGAADYWYQKGHAAGLQEGNITAAHKDLWNFRLAHARARIAARRGKADEAKKFVAAAKAILDKGTNSEQRIYFPYLTGYVAFYAGDYAAALADLQEAQQTDPFIQCLMAQSYEKLGNQAKAQEYYRLAANSTAHSVPAAFARPFARRKME
jgi:tetratricopeptide (TPR) repeat protein